MTKIAEIYRYPVKGLSADRMDSAALTMGRGLPFDRHWAIVHASSKVDAADPKWAHPSNFLRLAQDDKLAQLGIQFDEESQTLTLFRKGRQVSKGRLDDHMGRTLIQTFLSSFMPSGPRGVPKLVEAPVDDQFTDLDQATVSLINLASVQDLERVTRVPVDPLRFRGNVYLSDLPAWKEFDWVGKRLQVGECVLEPIMRIDRCAATNVDPETGTVDMNIPLALRQGFGHIDCGVHAKVIMGGTINPGDSVSLHD